MVGVTDISTLTRHDVQAAGIQYGEFLQDLMDEGQVGANAAGAHNTDARQPSLAQHKLNRVVMDSDLVRQGTCATSLHGGMAGCGLLF